MDEEVLNLVIFNWMTMHGTALMPYHIAIEQIWRLHSMSTSTSRVSFSVNHETQQRSCDMPALYSATTARSLGADSKSSE